MDKTNPNPNLSASNYEYEQQLSVERYILGDMDEQEATEFEAFFLSNQECLDQLEIAERLYEGLKLASNIPEFSDTPEKPTFPTEKRSQEANDRHGNWWHKKLELPTWMAAALVLVVLAPVFLFQPNMPTDETKSAPENAINVVNMSMAQRRGEANEVIEVSTGQQIILALYIDTELQDLVYPVYQFQLQNKEGNSVLAYQNLTLASDDMLYINLGDGYLESGSYQFEISGQREAGESKVLVARQISVE